MAELERQTILNAIAELNGDKLQAARLLGIGKTTLYRKLRTMHRRRDRGGPATLHQRYVWNTGLPIARLDPAFEGGSALTDLPSLIRPATYLSVIFASERFSLLRKGCVAEPPSPPSSNEP